MGNGELRYKQTTKEQITLSTSNTDRGADDLGIDTSTSIADEDRGVNIIGIGIGTNTSIVQKIKQVRYKNKATDS